VYKIVRVPAELQNDDRKVVPYHQRYSILLRLVGLPQTPQTVVVHKGSTNKKNSK
jgi:hypothetical protein